MYPISVVTELTGIEAHLLRAWEKAGLLSPRRSGGGTRRYSGDDVALLRLIRRLANDGLNIPGIRAVLRLEQRVADLEAEVRQLRNRAGRTPDIRVPLYQRLRLPGLGDA